MFNQKSFKLSQGGEISLSTGPILSSDGSSYFSQGSTSIIAGIVGPIQAQANKELIDRAYLDVNYHPKAGQNKVENRPVEEMVKKTFQSVIRSSLHPRTSIQIVIQEIMNDGGLLACIVNATCLALLNAAIPMNYMVSATHCCISDSGNVIFDPSAAKLEDSLFDMTLIMESEGHEILGLVTHGCATQPQLTDCISKCKNVCLEKMDAMKEYLVEELV